jgi:hypothetical protein
MRRSSRFNRPGLTGSSRSALLLNNDGDGSTLTLDFTTGVLDPRLTFTRAGNATFINSSGFVQYADANMVVNSVMSGPATPTGWSLVSGGAGATIPSTGVRRLETTTAAQNWLQNVSNYTTAQGLLYSTTAVITAVSGQHYQNTMSPTGGASVVQFYRDGVAVSGASGGAFQTAQPGVITCVWQASSSSGNGFRIGVGSTGSNVANGVCEFSELRTVPGSYPIAPYFANANTVNPYHAPRFDYDPTTRAPRGLLIEGTATNLLLQSNDWNTTWNNPAPITWNGTTYTTAPDGTNTAKQITVTAGSSSAIGQAAATGTNRTISVWLKAGSLTSFSIGAFESSPIAPNSAWGTNAESTCSIISGPGSVSQQVGGLWSITGLSTTAWTRIQIFRSSSFSTFLAYPGSSGTGINGTAFMWGMQMEAGNGASSLIPTGASQATRNRDELTLTNLSSIAFSQTSGTAFTHVEVREKATGNFIPYGSFDTSGGGRCWWWLRHNRDASVGTRMLGTVFNSGGSTAITTSNYQYNSGNGGLVKFATSLDTAASSVVYVIGGASPQTTTASAFTLATAARWSVNINSDVGATDLGSMWMRSFKYWPTNLPNATLQSLTT